MHLPRRHGDRAGPRSIPDRPSLQVGDLTAGHYDRLAAFRSSIAAVRVVTTLVAAGLTVAPAVHHRWWVVGWVAIVMAYNTMRVVHPVRDRGNRAGALTLAGELLLNVGAVAVTSQWDSPLAFPLLTAILIVGFARGFRAVVGAALLSAAVVAAATSLAGPFDDATWRLALQWTVELVVVGLTAGYVRHVSGDASRQQSDTLDQLSQLTGANNLLVSLHRVAQSLPESFDLSDTLEATMTRLRELFDADVIGVLLHDETDDRWTVARGDGLPVGEVFTWATLPRPARQALLARRVVGGNDLHNRGRGLVLSSQSGLYAPLVARDALVGMMALEYSATGRAEGRHADALGELVAPVSLAVDNARWFERLRTIGAEEERTRIARDLHDRIGQSLAYVAFELDRIVKNQAKGRDIAPQLQHLRTDLRGVIGDVRDTLYDLRTDVSETTNMTTTLHTFLDRVTDRSGLRVTVAASEDRRLPLLQEREMWRIAQEAVINVERHAEAHHLVVRWSSDDSGATLEVEDDGIGFPAGKAGRLDSYGILGMRERAASMGATLQIISEGGRGTTVVCQLHV